MSGGPVALTSLDVTARTLLWALACRAAQYRREWLRAEAAAKGDGGQVSDTGGGIQAFAHWAAGERMLADALLAVTGGASHRRRAEAREWLLTAAAAGLPEPSGGGVICPWCGRGDNPHTGTPALVEQWPVRWPRTSWHDSCRGAYTREQEGRR